ncbi:MAG: peptidylprolyl isomerase [Alphaproteobacteria bacterium]|nr:peptidylprolyl isomerase [Alphaproteobacteria bacterium]
MRGAVVSTTEGTFRLALDPDTAPLAVATFAWLAEQGFGADSAYADVAWTGTTFHRVVPGFVVQSGDPRGDGLGGPGWLLPDETSGLPFVTGALGMATSGPDEGGSQWFVTTSPQPHLVGGYTRFGVVTDGLDVVQRLDPGDRVLDVVIERTPEATP